MESKLVLGDCIEKLKELDDCYVEAIITGMLRNAWL